MKYIREINEGLLKDLYARSDTLSNRIKYLLQKPDLSRKAQNPVNYIVEAVKKADSLKNHDLVEFPEIVSVEENFDMLGTPKDHPSRSPSDTFYLNERYLLRTQTTTIWPYYLRDPKNLNRLKEEGKLLALSYGKVYRNDEIDRYHYPVWHNMDGLCIRRSSEKDFIVDDLVKVLVDIAKNVYGPEIRWRVEEDTFPFTEPSIELQIEWKNDWVEVLGAGLVHKKVLTLLNINPDCYNGWAFGFGLDRLAMIKMDIPDIRILWSDDDRITKQFNSIDSLFREVSPYPATDRDVSLVVSKAVSLNAIYGLIRECGNSLNEDIIEEVTLIDSYQNDDKFGNDKISLTFRIRYRSFSRTLTHSEINSVQDLLRKRIASEFEAVLR